MKFLENVAGSVCRGLTQFCLFQYFQYFGRVSSILQECGDLPFIRQGRVSPLVKLTVGIISGFGKVNAQIFGKSCNCQKTGEIVFWGQIH